MPKHTKTDAPAPSAGRKNPAGPNPSGPLKPAVPHVNKGFPAQIKPGGFIRQIKPIPLPGKNRGR